MDSLTEGKKDAIALDLFAGGGKMGELMRSHDWSTTPLGSALDWPQSLRTSVSTMLASRFAQTLLWGEDYIQLYNGAMILIYGAKHPEALGYSLREIWSEVWNDQVKPMLEGIKNTGEAVFVEDQLYQLLRFSSLEETYFTFCYSPVWDKTGTIRGFLSTTTETTKQVISQRHLTTLRELATKGAGAKTLQSACHAAASTLNPYDIPFALFYRVDPQGKEAKLVASTGLIVVIILSVITSFYQVF